MTGSHVEAKFWTQVVMLASGIPTIIGRRPRSLNRCGFELEARGERGLGDLELLGRRLGRREPVLELVAGPRERPRERLLRVALHPAEELGRGRDDADGRPRAARRPRSDSGARAATTLPAAVVTSSGPTRCEPQRSCSRARGSPCS